MTPATYNITAYKGDTFEIAFTLQTADTVPAPIDLTGCTVSMQIRRAPGQPVLEEASTTGGEITISGAGNNVVNVVKVIDTVAGKYQYDLQVTYPSGRIKTYVKGSFTVTDEITNP